MPSRLHIAFRLGRVSNLPTVWTNVLAGTALAGAALEPWTALPFMLAMSLVYVGGMYLNDAFDAPWDAEHRNERPIPTGQVSRGLVFAAGFAMLALGLAVVGILTARHELSSARPLLAAGALTLLIIYYDAHHKQNPLSPLVMGLCRAGVYITAGMQALSFDPMLWIGSGLLLAHLVGLSFIARHETGPGRLTGWLALWPIALFVAPVAWAIGRIAPQPSAPVALALAAYMGVTLVGVLAAIGATPWRPRAHRRPDPRYAVPLLIAAISLLDGVFLAIAGFGRYALLAGVAFALTRLLQRFVPGT